MPEPVEPNMGVGRIPTNKPKSSRDFWDSNIGSILACFLCGAAYIGMLLGFLGVVWLLAWYAPTAGAVLLTVIIIIVIGGAILFD